ETVGYNGLYMFLGNGLLVVSVAGPNPDKPKVKFGPPDHQDTVGKSLAISVPDCQAAYDALRSHGAEFLTPPLLQQWGGEIRCFFRDPDGHLFEISQLV